jgi:hypothetical protein
MKASLSIHSALISLVCDLTGSIRDQVHYALLSSKSNVAAVLAVCDAFINLGCSDFGISHPSNPFIKHQP